jgi:hypothetical protein
MTSKRRGIIYADSEKMFKHLMQTTNNGMSLKLNIMQISQMVQELLVEDSFYNIWQNDNLNVQ